MLLPPNAYRADERAVLAHYREVAEAGLPVVAYNNPIDTKVDLVPALLARLHGEGLIVAVKEFTGDVRRAYEIAELAPELDVLVGADDVAAGAGARRGAGLDRRLPQRAARLPAPPCYRAAAPATWPPRCRSTGAAPAAALGLQDRVRPGHQAVHGPRPAATAGRAGRRAARSPRTTQAAVRRPPPRRPSPRKG